MPLMLFFILRQSHVPQAGLEHEDDLELLIFLLLAIFQVCARIPGLKRYWRLNPGLCAF